MATVNRKKPFNLTRTLFILSFTVIPVVMFLVFYVYVNLSSFVMAFRDVDGSFGFANFVRFFGEFKKETSDITLAFRNTFLTFGILLLAFPFKVLVSYFIYKKVPFYGFYRYVFFLPSVISGICVTMVFQQLIGVEGPIAQGVQELLGLSYTPELLADSRFANIVVILHMLWLGFPGDLIIWGGTFARIPEEVLQSARIDGVNWIQEFTKIIVPLVWPTVALQMVLTFCGIFGASGAVFLLTEGQYGTMTLTAWMYLELYRNAGSPDTSNAFNYMAAVGMILTVVAVTISVLIRNFTDKVFDEVEF